jgi:transcriptional regulator with XRE-family HTH domain
MYACGLTNKEEFLKLSYRELRERTGIEIAEWSKYFNGGKSPTLDSLRKVATRLEMPLLEFIEAFEERRSLTMQRKKAG